VTHPERYRRSAVPTRRLGALREADGTRFRVHAPDAQRVAVWLRDAPRRVVALDRVDAATWAATISGVGHGDRYLLLVDAQPVLDPYALAASTRECVVVDEQFAWDDDTPPRSTLADCVLYELHVRGFTKRCTSIPGPLRGTYAGLGSAPVVAYLERLGVTTVELLPVFTFATETAVARRGLVNYWGYSPVCWLAPHTAYAACANPAGAVTEFKRMVQSLHRAGISVVLDVVFNHTGEGAADDRAISLRGLDRAGYFAERDLTGCGNTLDANRPAFQELVLTTLRYWAGEMRVDGFRFDLGTVLGWDHDHFDPHHPLLEAIRSDRLLRERVLIVEPWHAGGDGYQLGGFPAPFAHWNDRFRDDVRDYWRAAGNAGAFAQRLTGSADVFAWRGRGPLAGVNYVASHDGFTLCDLVTYSAKRNERNRERNSDGAHEATWNSGAEGATTDRDVLALRATRVRSMLATVALSVGVPMLCAGDERARSQNANNNAYCQDNPLSWLDWTADQDADALTAFVASLLRLRRDHPVVRRPRFLTARDVVWFGPNDEDVIWDDPARCAVGLVLVNDVEGIAVLANGTLSSVLFPLGPVGIGEVLVDTTLLRPVPPATTRAAPFPVGPLGLVVVRIDAETAHRLVVARR
jgi:isoamylase